MRLTRRHLVAASATGTLGMIVANPAHASYPDSAVSAVGPNLAANITPISAAEREARLDKARRLMIAAGIRALLIEPGAAMTYFTGLKWWRSERLTGVIILADGPIGVVTPAFEEASIRESLGVPADVRTWNEHESPFSRVAGFLKDHGVTKGKIGVEGTVRHFIVDGVAEAAPSLRLVSGEAITRGCRMYKSAAEIALMQTANDITMAAYRATAAEIAVGMTPAEISERMNAHTRAFGGTPQFALVLIGEASAYPHGSDQPQRVREGAIILMDCGAAVEGYQSDISRTFVFGAPSAKQRAIWDTVKAGQELALDTARPGVPAGAVDRAVRDFYAAKGFGPGYAMPGLSHRLGHGIGLDGHEPVNFVEGETTPLAAGMCFSNEPGIYVPGEFGVRLEDCLYMTATGPKLFTPLSPSIDAPFGT